MVVLAIKHGDRWVYHPERVPGSRAGILSSQKADGMVNVGCMNLPGTPSRSLKNNLENCLWKI